MHEVEKAVNRMRSVPRFTLSDAMSQLPPGCTRDQAQMALSAMITLGAVIPAGRTHFAVSADDFDSGCDERARVRETIGWISTNLEAPGDLLISAPVDAKSQTQIPFERDFLDLRTAVRSLIAEAQDSLILAAPFWDLDVAKDLADLIGRRLEAGIVVRILGRPAGPGSATAEALSLMADVVSAHAGSSVRLLENPSELDRFGTATFHFKLAIADRKTAYLGSANFNTAGLASRWELGILLRGSQARILAGVADSLFEAASSHDQQ
jgi:phosphatidylserine/phosphatidylglycerophosphate/cardiolipin synthase-like enzyme